VPTPEAVIPWCILIIAIVKVARKADNMIARIGLNPVITGDALGHRGGAFALMMLAARSAVRTTASKIKGGSSGKGGNASSKTSSSSSTKTGGSSNSANTQSTVNSQSKDKTVILYLLRERKQSMEPIVIIIPANYTEAGKILGLFELRKLLEAAVLCAPILALTLFCLPFALTVNIVISAVLVVPLGGFALMGIHDYSLLNFIRIYRKWRKERSVLTREGISLCR